MRKFLLLAALAAPALVPAQAPARPNVVLIITDDVGYGDLSSYGAKDIETPNIDRIGRNGVRYTDFYAQPQCTPTRAALMTGRYQQRYQLERAISTAGPTYETGLPATGRSLPQLLKNHGYATGLVGKWHLGFKPEFSPNAHGFDYFYGFLSGYVDFYHHTRGIDGQRDFYENDKPVSDSGYMTDLITARAKRFVEQNAQKPFFLEVAYNAAHWPFQVPDHPTRAANNGAFGSAAITLDGGTLAVAGGTTITNSISFGTAGGTLAGDGVFMFDHRGPLLRPCRNRAFLHRLRVVDEQLDPHGRVARAVGRSRAP